MARIAILYICTGKYDIFWSKFYKSCENYFLKEHEKHYFVFTDSLKVKSSNRVHIVYKESLGWPYNTLLRFKLFLYVEEELNKFDYTYFFNSNMIFRKPVNEEVFPTAEESGLLGVIHPGYYNKKNTDFTYERNPDSTAFIRQGDGEHYFMGGFNGGNSKEYILLIRKLNENINMDLSKGIIASWHDESHLNAYFVEKKIKILSPAYGYAEGWDLPFENKITVLDKSRYGGHEFLRSTSSSSKNSFLCFLKSLKDKLLFK